MSLCFCVCVAGRVSVSVCLWLCVSFCLASPFTLALSPDARQLLALFTQQWLPFPSRCHLDSHGPSCLPQGLAPTAPTAGLTLSVIHCGKPPICFLFGPEPREITVQEKGKAGKGASWQHPPLLLETEIRPLPRPPIFPHALIQTKYLGSWPPCLWR